MIDLNLKILHLETKAYDIELLNTALSNSALKFEKFNVASKEELVNWLDNNTADIIISDWDMLSFTALDVLAILKARKQIVPFILVVSPEDENFAANAIKEGFADYLTRDRMQRLPFAILNAIEKFKLEKGRYQNFSSKLTTESLLTKTEKMTKSGTLEIDLLTNARKWSPGVDAILGFKDGEAEQSYETFINCLHPDDTDRVRREVDYAIKNLDKIDIEFRIITPEGIIKYIHSKLLFDADQLGRNYRASGFIRDITDNKIAELKLLEANKELNSLFNTIDEVFFLRDMVQSKLIQISPACEKMYGYTQDEFLGDPDIWSKIMHPEDIHIQQSNLLKHNAGEIVFSHYRVIHRVNGVRWAESKIIPSLDENGKLVRLYGVTRDITERKQLEQSQQQSEQRLRELLDNSTDIISVTNINGEIIFTSENVKHILGYDKGQYSKVLFDKGFVHPSELRAHQQTFRAVLENPGQVYSFSYRLKHANGNWVWFEGTIKNLLNLPAVNGIVANYRDISERKEAEHQIDVNRAGVQEWLLKRSSILNALPPQIALLDENGSIVDVNESWKKFGKQNGLQLNDYGIGSNYIAISDSANGGDELEGRNIAEGIKQVISGEKMQFSMEYPCHSPTHKNWFQVLVSPLTEKNNKGAVVLHNNITERKIAENKLSQSEQRYRHIVETAQEGIWVIDENLVTIFVNKKMCDMLEYPASEIIGKHNYDFKDDSQKQPTIERVSKRVRGVVETHESIFTTKSGKSIVCNVSTNGIFGVDNEFIGTLAMVTDITDRKAHEDALKKSEANLSAIIENTTDLVYSLNKDLQFITYNERFKTTIEHVYGFKVSIGGSALALLSGLPPKIAKKWKTVYHSALAGRTLSFVNEYPNGNEKVYLSYSVNPIWKTGEVIGLSCFSRDITQQKTNEVKLVTSEANLRSVFETTDLYTILFNSDLKVVSFNKNAAENALKYFGKKIKTGTSGFDFFPKSRWSAILQTLEKVKNRETVSYEVVYDLKGGRKEWFEAKWAGVFNAKKKMEGVILTLNLITEKKLAELERARITADLIRRNQDLEQFTYIVSHNLRVPVANIMGLSQLLGFEESVSTDFTTTLNALSGSINQLDNVINDLNLILEVSKQVVEKKETIVFARLIEEINIEIQSMLQKNKVVLSCNFSYIGQIFSIKPYVYSIFQNLIVNSIKYRRDDLDPLITIQTLVNDNKICISFEDNGKGIDLNRSGSQVFGLYKRFDFSVEGKGMGLFMVKKQVENLGGTICVQSQIGQGTKFLIELPL
ncbi:PAS domain S-box-containing protein [Mucilaginibacter frigoritolerans]|uniref:histidine kinase n=1 Tax=Mucilaginibacter frigoritolerans TaxID=652788 RepID=A0A562UDF5_9SPHI|nr:PAS domain S-box protein [Mucilaginibacter frigoritolerans]TWJ03497.1 PAS domain S-box-containing protein [Mucilaginibacter frigoritolerans]